MKILWLDEDIPMEMLYELHCRLCLTHAQHVANPWINWINFHFRENYDDILRSFSLKWNLFHASSCLHSLLQSMWIWHGMSKNILCGRHPLKFLNLVMSGRNNIEIGNPRFKRGPCQKVCKEIVPKKCKKIVYYDL